MTELTKKTENCIVNLQSYEVTFLEYMNYLGLPIENIFVNLEER
jgi:hypothetical protein